jgi:PAS domain-containing protein
MLFFWPLDAFIDSLLYPNNSFAILLLEPPIEERMFRVAVQLVFFLCYKIVRFKNKSIRASELNVRRLADDLTALIDTANAPIFGIDTAGLVNEWNQTAERITGYSKSEVMGRHLVDNFITSDYKVSVKGVLDEA